MRGLLGQSSGHFQGLAPSRHRQLGFAARGKNGDAAQQLKSVFHAGLTTYDGQGNIVPVLAQKVPSIDDGDWKLQSDGSMDVT